MTVKEMMLKLLADAEAEGDSPDIDFCDDYDESAYCAYCGNHWTPEAEEKYKIAFGLECEDYEEVDDCIIVHCEDDNEVNALGELLYAMAGYGDPDDYDRLFPDPEEDEPVPEHKPVEIVLKNGQVIKAKRVDFASTGLEVLEVDGDWTPIEYADVVRIIGEKE